MVGHRLHAPRPSDSAEDGLLLLPRLDGPDDVHLTVDGLQINLLGLSFRMPLESLVDRLPRLVHADAVDRRDLESDC